MSELAEATATVLADRGRFTAVTGRGWEGVEAVVDAAALHVVAPGPTTRLAVARGIAWGGHRSVTLLDTYPAGVRPRSDALALTTSAACAADALRAGWSVVQPWAGSDVPALLDAASSPTLVLLRGTPSTPLPDPPDARRARLWVDGDVATLVGSGAAVGTMLQLANRLRARGVDVAAVEVAILTSPAQASLVGGTTLLVAGRDTSASYRGSAWPDHPVTPVTLDGSEEADLIGMVLSGVSARS